MDQNLDAEAESGYVDGNISDREVRVEGTKSVICGGALPL